MSARSFPPFSHLPLALLPFLSTACFGGGGGDGAGPQSTGADASVQTADASVQTADATMETPDAFVPLAYGEYCNDSAECQGGICLGAMGNSHCSRLCNAAVAHDCRAENAFCVLVSGGQNACYGTIDVGSDDDETILLVNETARRGFHSVFDVDMFPVHINQTTPVLLQVTPDPLVDVELVVYNSLAEIATIADNGGLGAVEQTAFDNAMTGHKLFIVVKNVGNSIGSYTVGVIENPNP